MKIEEFYAKYANTSLDKRLIILNFAESGTMTLAEIYKHVDNLEDYRRTIKSQQDQLIALAEKYL